jgi:mannose-6-phosphate isomerase-like protein (cupin superfamily)
MVRHNVVQNTERPEDMMKKPVMLAAVAAATYLGAQTTAQQPGAKREPLTFSLECPGGDCVLLKGAPMTSGMRGGSVKLKPQESVGWHSTGENEEALTILHGTGVANIEGKPDVTLQEGMLAYIPSGTKHNVTNTGKDPLEYVWIVAPTTANSR